MASPRHHYVPQFYLRNFSSEVNRVSISMFNVESGKYIQHTPISKQASAKEFYASDKIEKALSAIEGVVAPIIRGLINGILPKWGSAEHYALLCFVLAQLSRTPSAVEEQNQSATMLFSALLSKQPSLAGDDLSGIEHRVSDAASRSLAMCLESQIFAQDLRFKLLVNEGTTPFLTSDNPVTTYNYYLRRASARVGTTGLGTQGLQILIPLDPKCTLILFDEKIYKIGGRRLSSGIIKVTNAADIQMLNVLQALNANPYVFCGQNFPVQELERLKNKVSNLRTKERVHGGVFPLHRDGKVDGEIVAIHKTSIPVKFELSPIRINPKAPILSADEAMSCPVRDPQLFDLREMYGKFVQQNKFVDHDFHGFLESIGYLRPGTTESLNVRQISRSEAEAVRKMV